MRGFPGSSVGKESACNAGDQGSIPGSGRSPGGGHGNRPQYSCHGQRSLAGCSSWGHKESDMTERVSVKYDLSVVLMCIFLMTLDVKHLFKFFLHQHYQESVKTTAIPL